MHVDFDYNFHILFIFIYLFPLFFQEGPIEIKRNLFLQGGQDGHTTNHTQTHNTCKTFQKVRAQYSS